MVFWLDFLCLKLPCPVAQREAKSMENGLIDVLIYLSRAGLKTAS